MQPRSFLAHTPGDPASQPCPSQVPDAQSSFFWHCAPSAAAEVGAGVSTGGGGGVGACVSVGVGDSLAGGALGGGDEAGGAECGPPQAMSTTTISNSRICMAASYTLRRE